MKLKALGMLTGLGLLLPSAGAFAHTDVYADLGLGFAPPPAVVVEEGSDYYYDYYPRTRVYYDDYWYPRRYYYSPRVYARSYWRDRDWDDGRHDRGWHHGRHHHHH